MVFWCTRTGLFYQYVLYKLWGTFWVSREETCNFKYLSLNLKSSKHQITADQFSYIEQIKKIQINSPHKIHKNEPITTPEKDKLKANYGQIY